MRRPWMRLDLDALAARRQRATLPRQESSPIPVFDHELRAFGRGGVEPDRRMAGSAHTHTVSGCELGR